MGKKRKPTRALIVDDDADLAELVGAILTSAGMEAEVITKSQEAVERLPKEKFDVVFLDVRMPAPDGIEVARRTRAAGFNQKTPIVMITGESDLRLQRQAFDAGANFFLFKPVDRMRLLRVVRSTRGTVEREQRRFQRVGVSRKVSIATSGKSIDGTTVDLSLGGVLVQAAETLSKDSTVAVFLHLGGGPIRAKGRVVRVLEENKMAIQFQELAQVDSERLQEFLLPLILKEED